MTDEPLKTCPACGQAIRRLINGGSGIIFKGAGFYVTDRGGSGVKSGSGGKSASAGSTAPAKGGDSSARAPASGGASSEKSPKAGGENAPSSGSGNTTGGAKAEGPARSKAASS